MIKTQLETSFFATTPLGVYQTRPDGTIIAANNAFIRMLGIQRKQLTTINLNDYPLGAMYSRKEFKKKLEKESEIVGLEYRWQKIDGSVIYVRENAHIVRNQRKILYYEGTIEDITDRKIVEEKLLASQEQLQDVQDKLTFLDELSRNLAKDMDYPTRLVLLAKFVVPKLADWCAIDALEDGSLRTVAMAHVNPEKIKLAKKLKKEYPADDHADMGIWNVIKTGKPIFMTHISQQTLVSQAKDEKHAQMLKEMGIHSIIVLPLVSRGNTIGVITLANSENETDFTHNDFLFTQHIMRRASTLVDNARLYMIAQEEDKRRDHFLGIASHEMKNTLAGIKSYTQLLQRKLQHDPKNSEYLSKIDINTNRMRRLIDDLIDMTKLRAQKLTLILNSFEINQLIEEVLEETQLAHKERMIIFKKDTPRFVSADQMRIRQVLTNLLKNALKYSEDNTKIIVTTKNAVDSVRVSVQDFGTGIPDEDQDKIFELFYRVEKETTRTNGLGVGLYISNEIVKMHGGTFELKSEYGKGSTFSFIIPIATMEASK
jgi:PAS domain S-box-containing protein